MPNARIVILVIAAGLLSACASPVGETHSWFVPTLIKKKADASKTATFLDYITSLHFSPGNLVLTIGYESGHFEIYDTLEVAIPQRVRAHERRVSQLTASPDGETIATGSYFEEVTNIWSTASGERLLSLPETRGPEVFSQDGDTIFMADSDRIKIYRLSENRFAPGAYPTKGLVNAMALSPDGSYLAVGTTKGFVELWQIVPHTEGLSFWKRMLGYRYLALAPVDEKDMYEGRDRTVQLSFTGDGSELISVSRLGNIDIFQVPDLANISRKKAPFNRVNSASLIEEQRVVFVTGVIKDEVDSIGMLARVSLDSGSAPVLKRKISKDSILALLRESNILLIASGTWFTLFDLEE